LSVLFLQAAILRKIFQKKPAPAKVGVKKPQQTEPSFSGLHLEMTNL